jgi:hypothetical protein
MKSAKVFVFAPADDSGETHKRLEAQGCELVLGKASWDTPQGDNEADMARVATGQRTGVPVNKSVRLTQTELRGPSALMTG